MLVIALVVVLVLAVVFLAYKNCKFQADEVIEAYVEVLKMLVDHSLYTEIWDDVVHGFKTIKKALGQILRGLGVILRWLLLPLVLVFAPITILIGILWDGFTK